MGVTAIPGPQVSFGVTQTSTGGIQEYNDERGPNLNYGGNALYDPRPEVSYQPGSPVGTKVYGWWDNKGIVDGKPGTFSAVTIATTQVPVAGTPLTLQTASSGCITAGVTLTPTSNPNTTVSVLAIDSTYATAPRSLAWGTGGTVRTWDPSNAISRTLMLTRSASQDDTAATYTIQGYDIYGYKMTETITGTSSTGGSSYAGQKAFKYIQSITPAGTLGSTGMTVTVTNTYGFPLAVNRASQTELWMGLSTNMAIVGTQSTLLTFACTVTNTATTPDVRGTWASTNLSSNSSNIITMWVRPRAADIANMGTTYTSTGAWTWLGAPQYSS